MKKIFLHHMFFNSIILVVFCAADNVPPPPSCSKSASAEIVGPYQSLPLGLNYIFPNPSIEFGPITSYNNGVTSSALGSLKFSYPLSEFAFYWGTVLLQAVDLRPTFAFKIGLGAYANTSFLEFETYSYRYEDSWVYTCYINVGPTIRLGDDWTVKPKLGYVFYVYQ